MIEVEEIYCLDANVLIQAWQKYYSPLICPDYWKTLDDFGAKGRIFIADEVYTEIMRTEDDLSKWLKESRIPVLKPDEEVTNCLKRIYEKNENHKYLVDNVKGRSLADPWVIAHAIKEKATVVTKEEKVTAQNKKRIKIPNVCSAMGVRCIDDFTLIKELGIEFNCKVAVS